MRYQAVDQQPDPERLVAAMVAADAHQAVQTLRKWTIAALNLQSGQSIIDVGCGPGASTVELARIVGPDGLAVGIDLSTTMIAAANRMYTRSTTAKFSVDDACNLEFPDGHFDAYRSERTYQHLATPEVALGEARRVVRPNGKIAIVDTDWGSLAIDHPNRLLTERLAGMPRRMPLNSWSGRRLVGQLKEAGCTDVEVAAASIIATSWDPDQSPGVAGFPPFATLAAAAVANNTFSADEGQQWLAELHEAARSDRFFLMVTMVAVCGKRP